MKKPARPQINKPKKEIRLPKLGSHRPPRPGIKIGRKSSKGY